MWIDKITNDVCEIFLCQSLEQLMSNLQCREISINKNERNIEKNTEISLKKRGKCSLMDKKKENHPLLLLKVTANWLWIYRGDTHASQPSRLTVYFVGWEGCQCRGLCSCVNFPIGGSRKNCELFPVFFPLFNCNIVWFFLWQKCDSHGIILLYLPIVVTHIMTIYKRCANKKSHENRPLSLSWC